MKGTAQLDEKKSDDKHQKAMDKKKKKVIKEEVNRVVEFSSDEEQEKEIVMSHGDEEWANTQNEEVNFQDETTPVEELNDESLFAQLREHGLNAGPILDSTREFYRKKLSCLRHGENLSTSDLGSSAIHEEYSADEEALDFSLEDNSSQATNTIPQVKLSQNSKSSPRESSVSSIRHRAIGTVYGSPEKRERFTPTPRRSIHTYNVADLPKDAIVDTYIGNSIRTIDRDDNYLRKNDSIHSKRQASKFYGFIKFLLKYLFVFIIIALLYYMYKISKDQDLMINLKNNIIATYEDLFKSKLLENDESTDNV